ncbi:ATP-binding protein [Streptomyces beigongshangae]|uniref:ATP-binding protein n=1 Tax=Streptomyces beigongshangae TaxID=2841597 RepID=UPI001C86674F|nr:ATP-binding protein [Streptomyces sp. REN17]
MDLVWVRQHVRRTAAQLGFGLVEQTRLVTAASELARNTLVHGGGGVVESTCLTSGRVRGLRLVFADEGPGIPDPDRGSLGAGRPSGGGLGIGLGGTRRLVHEFSVESAAGTGTRVTVASWAATPPRGAP